MVFKLFNAHSFSVHISFRFVFILHFTFSLWFDLFFSFLSGDSMLHFLSFQSHRSVTSLSKMALPVRNNLRSLNRFIQKFNSPKRFLCAAAAKVNKVREGLQMFYELMNVLSTFEELVFVKYFNNDVHNRLSCDCIIVWLSAVKFILQLRKLSCILLSRVIALFCPLNPDC